MKGIDIMTVFVIGGSGSGKSAYAEETALSLSSSKRLYYLATMRALDAEGKKKANRHKKLRSGKGFLTVEQPTEIHRAMEKMDAGVRTVLLECVTNLTANEMFSGGEIKSERQTAELVIRGIELLRENVKHLVVVSGNVFEDGTVYDEATMGYIRAMGAVNRRLLAMADRAVEVVAGIPVPLK